MKAESFQSVLDNYFTSVSSDEAIYGETIITMNYSGAFPMHSAIYGGKDKEGNIYVIEKDGGHEAPRIQNYPMRIILILNFITKKEQLKNEKFNLSFDDFCLTGM